MSYAERTQRWNEWYDALPDRWRFQVVLWPLLLIGTLNMLWTIGSGFPFGLLVVVAILLLAIVRLPYMTRRRAPPRTGEPAERTVRLGRVDWAFRLNTWYDGLPEWRRFWIFPAVLVVAGGINMALTLGGHFPFALLFLLALLALVALRAPYVWGWLTPPDGPAEAAGTQRDLWLRQDATPAVSALAPIGAAPAASPQAIAADHEVPVIDEAEPKAATTREASAGPPMRSG